MMSTNLNFPEDLIVGSSPRYSMWEGKGLFQFIFPSNNPSLWESEAETMEQRCLLLLRQAIYSATFLIKMRPKPWVSTGHWTGPSWTNQENVPQTCRFGDGSSSVEAASIQDCHIDNQDQPPYCHELDGPQLQRFMFHILTVSDKTLKHLAHITTSLANLKTSKLLY